MNWLKSVLGVIFVSFMALITLGAYRAGKDRTQVETNEEVLDDIYVANKARDRLDADPEYAERVRKRFTR